MSKRKPTEYREFLREFTDGIERGQLTVHRLSGIYMEPIKKDDTIVMALHTGEGGHGIVIALTHHTATTLLQVLGTAVAAITDGAKEFLDKKEGPASLTVPIEPYEGKAIVRVRVEEGRGLVEPPVPN